MHAVFTTRVLGLVHELCMKRIHVTKRDLFYTDVKLFEARLLPWVQRTLCGSLHNCTAVGAQACMQSHHYRWITKCFTTAGTWSCTFAQRRTRATRTLCWTMWPACWAARAPACMVNAQKTLIRTHSCCPTLLLQHALLACAGPS